MMEVSLLPVHPLGHCGLARGHCGLCQGLLSGHQVAAGKPEAQDMELHRGSPRQKAHHAAVASAHSESKRTEKPILIVRPK